MRECVQSLVDRVMEMFPDDPVQSGDISLRIDQLPDLVDLSGESIDPVRTYDILRS